MSPATAYDQATYWIERGKTYREDFPARPHHGDQERAVSSIVASLRPSTVLDVGCGFGRMGPVVLGCPAVVSYIGIDVSPDQIVNAASLLTDPRAGVLAMALEDLPEQRVPWDLVLAVEFLMHVPPERIEATLGKLRGLGRRLLTIDWDRPIDREPAAHNFLHDYAVLFGPGAERIAIGEHQGLYLVGA